MCSMACFIRDSAGALKLHTAAPVQYFRPEIVGFVCGSFLLALLTREYKSTAGSSPMVRFILGAAMMIGELVFLGCPLRMVLRMSAGDLNAWVALIGFAGGVATGSFFLKKGFSLGRAYEAKPLSGAALPVLLVALLVIGTATGVYAMSTEGPGSKHAPVILSLVAALIIGALVQKSRMCFAGSIRGCGDGDGGVLPGQRHPRQTDSRAAAAVGRLRHRVAHGGGGIRAVSRRACALR